MAEVVLSLELERSGRCSPHHDLFVKVSDGQVWKISRDEYANKPNTFRTAFQGWCRKRNWTAATSVKKDGSVVVQVFKDGAA